MKRVFSGIQPSGNIHIGNYFGAIKNWVDSQSAFDNIFCVVDLHAITVRQDPKILKEKIREVVALLLACGIDAEKSVLFAQSHIPAHSELAWILNCFIPMGWMKKMTQFKEKSEGKKEEISVGLFDYPALMAADILLYDTDIVPVGEDQKQHVELARDAAKRFNSLYPAEDGSSGETFVIPEPKLPKSGNRIMSLQNPNKKMSKSDTAGSHSVYLLEKETSTNSKIMKAVTDSGEDVRFEKKRVGLYNLLTIYKLFSGLSEEAVEKKFEGKGYAEFKKDLADLVNEKLRPIREKYENLRKDEAYIENILRQGAEKLRPVAEQKIKLVKEKIGLG